VCVEFDVPEAGPGAEARVAEPMFHRNVDILDEVGDLYD
jgi:hypothetical protein